MALTGLCYLLLPPSVDSKTQKCVKHLEVFVNWVGRTIPPCCHAPWYPGTSAGEILLSFYKTSSGPLDSDGTQGRGPSLSHRASSLMLPPTPSGEWFCSPVEDPSTQTSNKPTLPFLLSKSGFGEGSQDLDRQQRSSSLF